LVHGAVHKVASGFLRLARMRWTLVEPNPVLINVATHVVICMKAIDNFRWDSIILVPPMPAVGVLTLPNMAGRIVNFLALASFALTEL